MIVILTFINAYGQTNGLVGIMMHGFLFFYVTAIIWYSFAKLDYSA